MDTPIPEDIHEREEEEITYYQWVPLILIFQAFLFKLPNVFWKMLNGVSGLNLDRICKLSESTQMGSPEGRKEAIDNIAFFMDRWLLTNREYKTNILVRVKAKISRVFCCFCNRREGNFLTALYLCIKVMYLINIISQFFILNAFMATDYNLYGFEYIQMWTSGVAMRESPRFPRVTLCDFRIRQLENIQRWTVQCVLPINLFNEKIFVFLWFWFFFIAFLTGVNIVKWLVLIIFKRNNYQYVKKYLTITSKVQTASDKKLCRRFAESYLRDDGCFVARMIGTNSTDMVITDLLDAMWVNYRLREEPKGPEYTPEDEESKANTHSPLLNYRGPWSWVTLVNYVIYTGHLCSPITYGPHVRKHTFGHVRPAIIQISLGVFWIALDALTVSSWEQRRSIRLRGCAGWFKSLFGSHVRRYIFYRCCSTFCHDLM